MAFLNLNKRIAYIDNKKIILRNILKYEESQYIPFDSRKF